MSQFGSTFEIEVDSDEIKTSGLAVGSLVSSLICCIPITTILGVLLGIAAIFTISANPARKGKGLAVIGIVLGILFTAVQITGYRFMAPYWAFAMSGPTEALEAGFNGDAALFRSHFVGAGATASDAEATRFIDEMRSRYGGFISASFDPQNNQQQPGFGQTTVKMVYVIEFEQQSMGADVWLVFVDEATGAYRKLDSITIFDAEGGNLTYPPPPDAGP